MSNPTPEPPLTEVIERLSRIEATLQQLIREKSSISKEWHSTSDVAAALNKAEYTVREWCRQGRVRAVKKSYTRGAYPEWLISQEELTRIRNEGLLPLTHAGVQSQ